MLVIPQTTDTSVPFAFNLRPHVFHGVTRIISHQIRFLKVSKKSKTIWLANALEEAGNGQDTGGSISFKIENVKSLFVNVKK